MSSHVNWKNPYAIRAGEWYRGNLHTHTSPASGCAQIPMERSIRLYKELGYDFLSISDHMTVSRPENDDLVFIPGIEWNSETGGNHTGAYSADPNVLAGVAAIGDHEQLLRYLASREVLVILNHPNWGAEPHYTVDVLEQRQSYDGVEICNAVIDRLSGRSVSTEKWDHLLTSNKRILGFASDDSHSDTDIGKAWIYVRALKRTTKSILDAIRSGNFYCSSGVVISDIRNEDGLIVLEAENTVEIQVIGAGGELIESSGKRSIAYDVSRMKSGYVRFACYGEDSSMAWTQPLFPAG